MTRIFIEGYELDVNQGFTNQLTYSIDDLSQLDAKTTSFSKTIVLPGTANNNKLLGNIFEFGNSNFTTNEGKNVFYNFNASKSAQARIEMDGLQVMKGVLRLLEIIIDGDAIEYEVALFGELGGFYTSLGAKKIEELDFSEHNHTYSIANITASWDASGGTGYYYPLIDYGNVSPASAYFNKKNFYYTAFRPALFLREYVDKIIRGAGYTWESNFFNTAFFKRLIVPNNQTKLSYKKSRIFSASPTGTISLNNDITLTNQVFGNFTTANNITYTYTGATTFTGTINCNFSGTWKIATPPSQLGTAKGIFRLYKNGSYLTDGSISLLNPAIIGGLGANNISYPFNISFNFGDITPITLATNDTFKIRLEFYEGNSGLITTFAGNSLTLDARYPLLTPALLGDDLRISDTIPANVLQKDFFSSVMKMFNLIITEDKYTEKKLIIEPYVDFFDTANYIDWSNKVDRSQVMRIKPMSEINARFYTIKYKQDSDFFNEDYRKKWAQGYGDRVFDNQQEFAKDSDSVEVIFSNSPLVGYSGEDKIFPAIYKKNNEVEESISHNIRIMQIKKITGVATWKIYSEVRILGVPQTLHTSTVYPYAGHLDDPDAPNADLCFGVPNELYFELAAGALGNNLFNAYYSPYFAEITDKDSRLLKCKMKFNIRDIYNLDFSKFILIDGVLYRLYKISDYSDGETCNVELLRVIYTTY